MDLSNRERIWTVLYENGCKEKDDVVKRLMEDMDISEICAKLLYNRGYKTEAQARIFLSNESTVLHDPYLMKDMERAVERLARALADSEKIVIYGDYDVDGVTAVSCMYLYLSSMGADIDYYIPSRSGEGYGLSCAAIDKLSKEGVGLIITVDTGITASDEARYASEHGIDMIITDHHECHNKLPEAYAVVNPHRPDCEYPFKDLAGVGVVFKFICAYELYLCRKRGEEDIDGIRRVARQYADLAAIGTIADVMPIRDENRLIVKFGLKLIQNTERKGLVALIDAASSSKHQGKQGDRSGKKRHINSGYIGFGIAPRINAAGRISSASKAVELLLADSDEKAEAMAKELCEINALRQVEENKIADEAYKIIEREYDIENGQIGVIVLDDDRWQQGIVGIVASRITEKYRLPSILISFDGATRGFPSYDDVGKGSARSVKGMNLVDAMSNCEDLLVRFGGHELAAGLTIKRSNIPEFRRRINEYALSHLNEDMLSVKYEAECEVTPRELSVKLAEELTCLEPFGVSNPTPLFILRDVRVLKSSPIGGGKHSKLLIENQNGGAPISAVCFGIAYGKLDVMTGDSVDLLFSMDINEYQNIRSLQLIVQDIKVSRALEQKRLNEEKMYESVKNGAEFTADDDYIPTRDDFATVYTVIRREFRLGHSTLSEKHLLMLINQERGNTNTKINYIKFKFILRILQELNICGVNEVSTGFYMFDVYFNPAKTSIDKSSILHKLKSQCRIR